MNDDGSKTIIRIIQDSCFSNSASELINEFALAITPSVIRHIRNGDLDLATFRDIAAKRKDFFIANDLEFSSFCKRLFEKLNFELFFYDEISFYDSIITFKRKMENGNSRAFPKEKTTEDMLKTNLVMYLQEETFCEPRSASGNNDITVPSKKIIIETKLWNGNDYYQSGFPELNEYLEKNNYSEGYYIIFDYNKTTNPVILENGVTFDVNYQNKLIHVIFVKMNSIRPSQIHKENKKQNKATNK
jgi:hypothetical protein